MNNWSQLKDSSAHPSGENFLFESYDPIMLLNMIFLYLNLKLEFYIADHRHMDSKFDVDRINNCGPGESGCPANTRATIISAATRNGPNSDKYKSDPLDALDCVKINNTLESPMSTIISVLNDSKDKDLRFVQFCSWYATNLLLIKLFCSLTQFLSRLT